jgi:hypothetical protein
MRYVALMYSDPTETKAMSPADLGVLDFHVTAVEVREIHDSVEPESP